MKPYEAFFDDLMPELPGAETALVLHHVKKVCGSFYEDSLYGRQWVTPIDLVSGQSAYAIAPADAANFGTSKVLEVLCDVSTTNGGKLDPKSIHELNRDDSQWRTRQGSARYYAQESSDSILLVAVPCADALAALKVRIAVAPLYDGGGIDDTVFEKFSDDIAAGVKARLMRMGKKPWTDQALASKYEGDYKRAVSGAAAMAARDFGSAPLRTRCWG